MKWTFSAVYLLNKQVRGTVGYALQHAGEAYSAPPDPLAGFEGPTSKGREGGEGEGW